MEKRLKPLHEHESKRLIKKSTRGIADFMKRRLSREFIAQFRNELGGIVYDIENKDIHRRTEMDRVDCKFARELRSELPLVIV